MGVLALVAAWSASMAPLVLESVGLLGLDHASRLALALLPWLALAGLPRTPRVSVGVPGDAHALLQRVALPLALALPVLVTAGALDRAAGVAGLAQTGLVGASLLVLLAWAAESARRDALHHGLHAGAWLVLVPGTALLAAALTWGAAPGQENPSFAVTAAARASPLVWGLRRAGIGESADAAPFLAALVLLGLGLAPLPRRNARVAGLCVLGLCAAPAASDGSRVAFARFELVGPLAEMRLDAGRAGATTLSGPRGALVSGEQRTVRLPVPVPETGALDSLAEPEIHVSPAAGRARFLGWEAGGLSPDTRPLLLRPRPELGPRARGAPTSLLLWLTLAFAAGLAARARLLAVLGITLGATLVAAAIVVLRPAGAAAELRLTEGVAGGPWLELEIAADALTCELDPTCAVLFASGAARPMLRASLDFDAAGPVSIECPGETVTVARARGSTARQLARAGNLWGDFESTWTRAGDGTWSVHGPWLMGKPLPVAQAQAEPPGWLAATLPMGRSAFLGRLARSGNGGEHWVRVLDL